MKDSKNYCFFFNMHFSVFEALRKISTCDRQIKTIHCSHNYLEWSLNSKFKLKLFDYESRFFANIWETIVKIPYFSFLRMQWLLTICFEFPFRMFHVSQLYLVFSCRSYFYFWQMIYPKRKSSILTNCDGQFPAFLRLHGKSRRQL